MLVTKNPITGALFVPVGFPAARENSVGNHGHVNAYGIKQRLTDREREVLGLTLIALN